MLGRASVGSGEGRRSIPAGRDDNFDAVVDRVGGARTDDDAPSLLDELDRA